MVKTALFPFVVFTVKLIGIASGGSGWVEFVHGHDGWSIFMQIGEVSFNNV